MIPAKVVDASALAALVFGEPEADEAGSLLRGSMLFAPPLLAYELTNIACTKVRRHPNSREEVLQALEDGLSMAIQWRDADHLAACRLALQTGLTATTPPTCSWPPGSPCLW